jgi:hypothetical protein
MVDSSAVIGVALILGRTPQLVPEAEKELQQVAGLLRTLQQVLPVPDLFLGGGILVLIVLLHGGSMRMVQNHVIRHTKRVAQQPGAWRADVILATAIFLMLLSHLAETLVWTALLVWAHLVPSWREAGYFAANTYTTLGYGTVVLSQPWKMLAPIIAISGLFTFGWTGSVLVDVVSRVGRLRELGEERRSPTAPSGPTPGPELPDVAKK